MSSVRERQIKEQLQKTHANLISQINIKQSYYESLVKLVQEKLLPSLHKGDDAAKVEEYVRIIEIMDKVMLSIVELTQKREYIHHLVTLREESDK